MAGLFRRFRKEKSTETAGEDPIAPEEPSSTELPDRPEPGATEPAAEPVVQAPPVKPTAPPSRPAPSPAAEESRPPPPLPLPASDGSDNRLRGGPGAFARCFLCGSRLDGPWCPTCRMVWND